MQNLYEELGVERDADDATIKSAYRSLAQQNHPDKVGGDTARFQDIKRAYETLSDAAARAEYDATGKVPGAERTLHDDAMDLIRQSVEAALTQVNVELSDVLKRASDLIVNAKKAVKVERDSTQQKLDAVRKAMKRTTAKTGKKDAINPVMAMLEAKFSAPLAAMEHGEKAMALALAILADHDYKVDARAQSQDNYTTVQSRFAGLQGLFNNGF